MKRFFLFTFCLLTFHFASFAQLPTWVDSGPCGPNSPTLQLVLINSCGLEPYHEFFIFNTGNTPYNPAGLTTTSSNGAPPPAIPPSASNYVGIGNPAIPSIVAQLNAWAGCGTAFVAAPNPIPPNSSVMAFNSSVAASAPLGLSTLTPAPNLSSYCGRTTYVIAGNYAGAADFFKNTQSGNPLIFNFGGCTTTLTYGFPISQTDGTYITCAGNGVAQYNTGTGCFPPGCGTPTATATASGGPCFTPSQPVNLSVTSNAPAGSVYLWTGPNGFNSNQQNPTVTGLPAGNNLINVKVQVPGGCFKMASLTVTVSPPFNFTPLPDLSVCGSASIPLSVSGSPAPSAGASYLWNGPGLFSIAPSPLLNTQLPVAPATSLTNTYSLTITETNGCKWLDTFKLTTIPMPPVLNVDNPLNICSGQALNLNINSATMNWNGPISIPSGSNPKLPVPVKFSWTGVNGFSGVQTTDVLPNSTAVPAAQIPSATGSYLYKLTPNIPGLTHPSCSMPPIDVSVNIQPGGSITVAPLSLCQGQNVDLNTLITAPTPAPAGAWTGTGVSGSPNFNSSTLAPGQYSVTFTPSASACLAATSTNVTVSASPNVTLTQSGNICGLTPPFSGQVQLNATGGFSTYDWSTGVTGSGSSVSVTAPGTYQVTVTNSAGCSVVKSIAVSSFSNPLVAISAPPSLCTGANATLTLNSSFSGYLWNDNTTGNNLTINAPGTYNVTVTDANGCSATAAKIIAAASPLNPTFAPFGKICGTGSVTLSLTSSFDTYSWSNSLGNSPFVTVNNGQTYSVTVSNTASGCTGVATANVLQFPNPTVDIDGNLQFCPGGTGTTLSSNPATFASYLWSNGSNSATTAVTQAQLFSLTVTDINGCTASTSKTTSFFPIPTPVITGSTSICSGSSTTLDAGPGYASYLWSNGATGQTITTSQAGLITVSVTDAKGCVGTDVRNIINSGSLTFNINGNTSFCDGLSTTLNAGSGFSTYLWSTGETTQSITVNTTNTYSVSVSNGACTGSSAVFVVKNPLPSVSITGNASFCDGKTTALSTNIPFSNYRWNTGQNSQTINISSAGTYTVTVQDVNGCTAVNQINVVAAASPNPTIVGKTSFCAGDSSLLSLSENYSSYRWSDGSINKELIAKSFTTYTVTVTAFNGCSGSNSVTLNRIPDLKPQILGKREFCENDTIQLSVNAPFGSYKWSSGQSARGIVVNKAGIYKLTVSSGSCSGTDSVQIKMNPLPVINISSDTAVCEQESVVFSVRAGYANYLWSTGETTVSITAAKKGSYLAVVSSDKGCTVRDSVKLTVNPLPAPNIVGQSTICFGEKATLSLSEQYKTYVWSNGKTTDTVEINQPGKYMVTVTDNNGCINSTSKDIDVKSSLSPLITGKTAFCKGDSVILGLDASYASYKWSTTQTSAEITVKKAGNYSVTVTSASGCSGTKDITISENSNPSPVIAGSLFICGNNSTILDAGAGYSAYRWTNGETTQKINASSQGSFSVTVTTAAGCTGTNSVTLQQKKVTGAFQDTLCKGDFKIFNGKRYDLNNPSGTETLVAAASGGCDSILGIQLFFRPDINIGFDGDKAICSATSVQLRLNVTGFTGSFDAVMEDSDGTRTNLTNVKNGDIITVTPSKTQVYKIISVNISNGNCTFILGFAKVTVAPLEISTKVTQISCSGKNNGSAEVTARTGSAPFTFKWDTGAGTPDISGLQSGVYKVTITDAIGCSSIVEVSINEPQPISATLASDSLTCLPSSGSIRIETITGGSGNFVYSIDGTTFLPVNVTPFRISNLSAGDYTVTIREATAEECNWTGKVLVSPGKSLIADLGPDIILVYGDSVVLTPVTNFQMDKIRWSPATNLSCDTCQFAIAKPKVNTNYRVNVWDENGCLASDEVQITINQIRRVYIPNVFSPNVDGNNDLFRIYLGDETVKVNYFRILDRWGEIMYEDLNFTKEDAQDDRRGWNGYFRGKLLNPGVYIYSAQVEFSDGEVKNYTGDFMLMKQ